MDKALQFANQHQQKFIEELKHILRIPSISTLPQHREDIIRMSEWLKVHFMEIGLNKVQILPTKGHPILYGEWTNAKNKPTILIYGHYDVQPADPIEQWHTPPFEPTIKNKSIYARGASDDKAQFFTHLKAIQSYLQTNKSLPVNIKIILEGEEELGSKNLESFISKHQKLIQANIALVSDTHMIGINQPQIEISLRGLVYFEINIQTAKQDLHSGTYGGGVANAANILTQLLNQLKNSQQKILIPHFYDQIKPLTHTEKKHTHTDINEFKKNANAYHYISEPGYLPHTMPKFRPSLDINGIQSGFTGIGPKTIIPSQATAKISCRLVPNQNPAQISHNLIKYLKNLTPPSVKIQITQLSQCNPVNISPQNQYIKKSFQTLQTTFGEKPKFSREGGSIPVVEILQRISNIDTVLMGYGLPDDNLHAPNEKFYLPHFQKGIEANIRYYQAISQL